MTQTRTQKAQDFLRNVFDLGPDSSLELALKEASMMDIGRWIMLTNEDLKLLVYADPKTQMDTHISTNDILKMRAFKLHVMYVRTIGKDPRYNALTLTKDEYEEWETSTECVQMLMSMTPTTPTPSKGPVVKSTIQLELESFKKGIKRDPSLYPILKEDNQWDAWNRSVVATARAQSVDNVLKHAYLPVTHEETLLFTEQQKFMYSVFE
jgi:hypothetical protein